MMNTCATELLRHVTHCFDTVGRPICLYHGMHGMAWHGMAWHGKMAWHGMAWHVSCYYAVVAGYVVVCL